MIGGHAVNSSLPPFKPIENPYIIEKCYGVAAYYIVSCT